VQSSAAALRKTPFSHPPPHNPATLSLTCCLKLLGQLLRREALRTVRVRIGGGWCGHREHATAWQLRSFCKGKVDGLVAHDEIALSIVCHTLSHLGRLSSQWLPAIEQRKGGAVSTPSGGCCVTAYHARQHATAHVVDGAVIALGGEVERVMACVCGATPCPRSHRPAAPMHATARGRTPGSSLRL
jgi:hypothetical protein